MYDVHKEDLSLVIDNFLLFHDSLVQEAPIDDDNDRVQVEGHLKEEVMHHHEDGPWLFLRGFHLVQDQRKEDTQRREAESPICRKLVQALVGEQDADAVYLEDAKSKEDQANKLLACTTVVLE